jgi:hypothetical integral membrane protein (TIGR02206 family)
MPTTTQAADPLGPFPAFGAGHMVMLALLAFATAIACAAGVRWRDTAGLRRAERIAGWLMLAVYVTATIYWLLPANFHIAVSIPVHMCDMTGLLAPLVLLTRVHLFRTLLYFWGLGLSSQGVLTPILDHGPEHVTFYLYWLVHLSIIGTAVYDLVARRYRPAFRDCLLAIGWCAVWLALVLAVNLTYGVNYGYVGNITPDRPTAIDALGPWPLRVYKMIVAVLALFVGMWLPWAIAGRRQQRLSRQTGSGRSAPSAAAGP